MKTLILYTSKTGNTKTYAEDIAKGTLADVFPLKGFRLKKMTDYDTIVYGGWVRGGVIQGLDKFLSEYDSIKEKNVIIFGVGMALPSSDGRSLLIEQNLLDMYHVRFYQFRGAFDMQKLNFLDRMMLQKSLQIMIDDPANADNRDALLRISKEPLVCYDREKVDKLISVINSLSLVVEVNSKDKA
jgi:menaquinone-dependent protoporphyrinogen IX oxidase